MAISVPVKDLSGKQVANLGLNEAVFGVEMNEAVVYQALVRQRANERQGTASAKTRGEVSGTTRKPWRQKHTGRARVGTRMSPLWRHGGVVFGPSPRSYAKAMPRKMRRLAIRCLLSDKRRSSELSILQDLNLEGKTKEIVALFEALDIGGAGVLIVTKGPEAALIRGARNLERVKTIPAALLSVGDLLKYRFLVMTVDAVRVAEQIWARQTINRNRVPGMIVEEEAIPEAIQEAVEVESAPKPEPVTAEAAPDAVAEEAGVAALEQEAAPVEEAVEDKTEEAPKPPRRRTTTTTRSRSARAKTGPKGTADKPAAEKKPPVRRPRKKADDKGEPAS